MKTVKPQEYVPTKKSNWCTFYVFVLFNTYSGAIVFALSTLVVSYQVQGSSYLAVLLNYIASD